MSTPFESAVRLRRAAWLLAIGCCLLLLSSCRGRASARRASADSDTPSATPVQFEEIAETVGLRYAWGPVKRTPLTNVDSFGAGCGFVDLNRDGLLDVVAVGAPGIRVFLAKAPLQYEDRSEELGVAARHGPQWTGVACADYDGDGWIDLLVSGFKSLRLLRNVAGTRLEDRTRAAGLTADNWGRWGASVGFADLDGDGDLDLVVTNYVPIGPKSKRFCELAPGVVPGCPPREYDPEYARVYRNEKGRFRDVTVAARCNTTHGKVMVLAFCDYNSDGRTDIYLGNDGTPSDLLRNEGDFRFRNVGIETGAAFGTTGQPSSAMGADWGDFDGDGRFDLVVSAYADEEFTLLRQTEQLFTPISDQIGMGLATFKPLGFGAKFLDADNDGRLDIHFTNGHVYDNVPLVDPSSTFAQRMMLFHQRADGTVADLAPAIGGAFAEPLVGRGSAVGDCDNDGKLDLLVTDLEGRLRLFRNTTSTAGHWLGLDLRSRTGDRFAYGARVELRSGDQRQLREVSPASSYLSSSDRRLHFGLGPSTQVDRLQVRWPSGKIQEFRDVPADQFLEWTEGEAAPRRITSR